MRENQKGDLYLDQCTVEVVLLSFWQTNFLNIHSIYSSFFVLNLRNWNAFHHYLFLSYFFIVVVWNNDFDVFLFLFLKIMLLYIFAMRRLMSLLLKWGTFRVYFILFWLEVDGGALPWVGADLGRCLPVEERDESYCQLEEEEEDCYRPEKTEKEDFYRVDERE